MSELKPEDKKLHKALNRAMTDQDFYDTILEAAQAKRIEQLQAEIEQLKQSRLCIWCRKELGGSTSVEWVDHLLNCKDHPLAKRIEQLQTELQKSKDEELRLLRRIEQLIIDKAYLQAELDKLKEALAKIMKIGWDAQLKEDVIKALEEKRKQPT